MQVMHQRRPHFRVIIGPLQRVQQGMGTAIFTQRASAEKWGPEKYALARLNRAREAVVSPYCAGV